MRNLIFNVVFLAVIVPAVAFGAKQELSLAETLRFAAQKAPALQIQGEHYQTQRLDALNTRSRLFPQLRLHSQLGRQGPGNGSLDSTSVGNASINLSMNLFNQGINWTDYKVSQLQLSRAKVEDKRVLEEQALEIVSAYIAYSQLLLTLEITEQRAEMLKEQYDRIGRGYRAGTTRREDYLRLQAQMKRTQIGLGRARSDIESAVFNLRQLIGVDVKSDVSFIPLPLEPSKDFDLPETISPKDHLQYQVQEYNVLAQEELRQQSQWNIFPRISVDTSIGRDYTGFLGDSIGSTYQWQAMLNLSYDLFQMGTLARESEIASSRYRTETYRLGALELELQSQLANLHQNLSRVIAELKLSQELLEIDERGFARIQSEYRRGQSSYLEFVEALENFLNSRTGLIKNYFEYQTMMAQWQYHKGNLYEEYSGNVQ